MIVESPPSNAGDDRPATFPDPAAVAQEIDWGDFRDHLATADKDGQRRWIYPKKPRGRFYQARKYVSWLLLGIMFAGPFIRIQGSPLLMINIVERRFSILGQIFWPQDTLIFAVAMLIFLTGIIIFTTAFGRLWCGWTCPQTVLMEMVFRRIEYAIEGDAAMQRALDASPWSAPKMGKKILKHGVFLGLSFIIGNTLLSYIIGSDRLLNLITDDPRRHWVGLIFMVLFTLVFYAIFARFREQACTFICPYGRFQSTMLDENTMVVAYDYKRGEKRAPLHRGQTPDQRSVLGQGDCIQCQQCVAVCPTGIDIRNGLQMECVNCTACIDACDAVMDKIKRPRGLIRLASHNHIERGDPQRFTPRMGFYSFILCALISLFLYLVFTRSAIQATFLRAPGLLYQTMADGKISNLYTVKVVNKTTHELEIALKLENIPGELKIMGGRSLRVKGGQLEQTSVLVELDPKVLAGTTTALRIGVYSGGQLRQTIKTGFVGPRDAVANPKDSR